MNTRSGAFVLMILLFAALPAGLPAAESGTNARQRLSAGDDVAASDISEEVRFGREVAARVIARYGLYDNAKLMKYVNLVGKALAMNTSRPELDFHFAVLNTDEINAYAAPGGYIFVTRGALLRMQSEAELAGVLAHEIGHVVEKHVVKELNIKGVDDSAVSGLARVIGGSTDSARVAFSQAVDKALDILFKDGYKREDEAQADKDAVLFCALTGYEPAGLVRFFERISVLKGKQTEVLDKTHPPYASRIAWLRSSVVQEGMDAEGYTVNRDRFHEAIKGLK
jgi:predicted Zn-dependent protease